MTLQISLLNEISFPRKALFRLFVSSSIESHPQTVLKNFKVGFPTNETILFSGELVLKRMTSSMTSIYSVTHIFCAFAFVQAREALLGV